MSPRHHDVSLFDDLRAFGPLLTEEVVHRPFPRGELGQIHGLEVEEPFVLFPDAIRASMKNDLIGHALPLVCFGRNRGTESPVGSTAPDDPGGGVQVPGG
jgi:hypothetical protein